EENTTKITQNGDDLVGKLEGGVVFPLLGSIVAEKEEVLGPAMTPTLICGHHIASG
ncbi:hypothetical protein PanWU01x14_279100, partial [Parasponia andersonii]